MLLNAAPKSFCGSSFKRKSRAFTLIEVIITLAVIGLMMGVSVPLVSSFSKAELRLASGRISALMRDAYNSAALMGGTSRLVFDLDEGTITLESQEQVQYLKKAGESEEEQKANSLDKNKEKEEEEEEHSEDNELAIGGETITKGELAALAKAMGIGGGGSMAPKTTLFSYADAGDENTSYTLPEGIKFAGFWAEHLSDELHSGKVYLYFFSMGYTEEAIIYITNEEGTIYSLEVAPLTGRITIHDERIPLP